ncbi:hypothetical protein BD289DRAFT_444491 [Coniella lustricola]|uniref:Secreted protein n=1 Tax=Coniella lustricola TaxID=2025994 RepID=A0A2T2ZVY0_9PEZI|nr:hypothetical protein BD289DRAFT_444491 [Coniella lustricola]
MRPLLLGLGWLVCTYRGTSRVIVRCKNSAKQGTRKTQRGTGTLQVPPGCSLDLHAVRSPRRCTRSNSQCMNFPSSILSKSCTAARQCNAQEMQK